MAQGQMIISMVTMIKLMQIKDDASADCDGDDDGHDGSDSGDGDRVVMMVQAPLLCVFPQKHAAPLHAMWSYGPDQRPYGPET